MRRWCACREAPTTLPCLASGAAGRCREQPLRRERTSPPTDMAPCSTSTEPYLALAAALAAVDEAAREADVRALRSLAAAHAALRGLEREHEATAAACEALLDERYSRLVTLLQRLNGALDATYHSLTAGRGSAHLSYTAERRLLFSQGVSLAVQPDGTTWRRLGVASLSGGQRALATLALSFALQSLFPSPLYFFDEVDAALDVLAAGRVAAWVKAHTAGPGAAQYLLVSHKPGVFGCAACLLGVYSDGAGSSCVVGHFEAAEAP